MKHDNGLFGGFHIISRFDNILKNMSKNDAQSACLDRLHKMNILLGTDYSSPIDIGLNQITESWADFVKLYLKHMLEDGIALLKGERAFVMKLEGEERVIANLKKG